MPCHVELDHANVCYGVEKSWPKCFRKPDFESLTPKEKRAIWRSMEKNAVSLYRKYFNAERLDKRLKRRRDQAYAIHYEIRYRKNFYEHMKKLAEPAADYDAPVGNESESESEAESKTEFAVEFETESESDFETESESESSLQTVIQSGTYKDSQNKQQSQQSKDLNGNAIYVIDSDDNRDAESPMHVIDDIAEIHGIDDSDESDDIDYPSDTEPFYAGGIVTDSVSGNLDLNSIDLITENRGTRISSSDDRYYNVDTESMNLIVASQTQSQSQDEIRPDMCATPGIGSGIYIEELGTPSIQAAQRRRACYVEDEQPIDEINDSNSEYSLDFISQKMFGKTSTQQ